MYKKVIVKIVAVITFVIGLFMLMACFNICAAIIDLVSIHGSAFKLFGYILGVMFLSVYGVLSIAGALSVLFGDIK